MKSSAHKLAYMRGYSRRSKILAHKAAKRAAVRAEIAEIKKRPCMDCHHCFPAEAMDFDHVRGTKANGIAHMLDHSFTRILEELAKCDLVCANCHRTRTFRRRNQ